ncbi:MAG TPA: hypothetical protein VMM13_05230 [Euzebya sp.]|nr:hypothetical protein [Euzebya sp.]
MTTDSTTTESTPILVTGGTGKTGRRVTDRLIAAGRAVRVASRGSVPPFDWTDRTSWPAAVQDVEVAYLCYAPDLSFPGAADVLADFARTAVRAGVRRAVLLSGRGEPLAHQAEEAVAATGLDLTVLRASFLAQNFSEDFLVEAVRYGRLSLPASGRFGEGVVDADDVADAAVAALLADSRHPGIPTAGTSGYRMLELTGPRLLDFPQMVEILSHAAGHQVVFDAVTPEAYLAELVAAGVPPDLAERLTELFAAIMDGRNATLTDGVQRLLGRQPRDFADVVAEAAATGVWTAVSA